MKPSLLSVTCLTFLVNQAHAQGLLHTNRISADLANQAVAAVVAKCASQGYAETGVLVDADGVQQAALRGDHAGAHTLESAFSKAYTAASFKTDTTALVERSKTVPVLANLFKLPYLLLLGGGIGIKVGDEVVGAIGAAGRRAANSTTPAPAPVLTRSRISSSNGRAVARTAAPTSETATTKSNCWNLPDR